MAVEQEIGVGLSFEAANTPPDLVELGESEAVGSFDDEGIAVGDIDAGFDDGRANEYVEVSGDKVCHDVFEPVFSHLPVADCYFQFGMHFAEGGGDCLNGADLIVQVEDLATSLGFCTDGLFYEIRIIAANNGLDGFAIDGRGFDDAHGAGTG